MKYSFWKSSKLAQKQLCELPPGMRNLLKASKFGYMGAGPRTLDSVISFMPTSKTGNVVDYRNEMNQLNLRKKIIHPLSQITININVIICLSQRDFPIGIHQRFLVLLAMKGLDLTKVQWVITDADLLGKYPMFPGTPESVDESNVEVWKKQFHSQLNTYLKYFINNKLNTYKDDEDKTTELFQTEVNAVDENGLEKLKDFTVSLKNVHLFSNELPWTLTSIVQSLDYDPYESTNTYVVGQTNTAKTTLVRSMLQSFQREFESHKSENLPKNIISDPSEITISPTVFSSKFTIYTVPGMKIIDTPGYVRTDGGIYSEIRRDLIHLLRIPKREDMPNPKTLTTIPQMMYKPTAGFESLSRINLGGLVIIKPWLVVREFENSEIPRHKQPHIPIDVTILRNMPGCVETVCGYTADRKRSKSQILKTKRWSRYLFSGSRTELVLDNIGSFTLNANQLPEDSAIYWEVYIPDVIRFLSRSWDADGNVILKHNVPITEKTSRILSRKMKKNTKLDHVHIVKEE